MNIFYVFLRSLPELCEFVIKKRLKSDGALSAPEQMCQFTGIWDDISDIWKGCINIFLVFFLEPSKLDCEVMLVMLKTFAVGRFSISIFNTNTVFVIVYMHCITPMASSPSNQLRPPDRNFWSDLPLFYYFEITQKSTNQN